MEKEKIIEEMAFDLVNIDIEAENGTSCRMNFEQATTVACELINKGYRKERQGEWIHSGTFGDMAKCSICGLIEHSLNEVYSRGTYNYCPNCGAKMRGE